MSFQTQLVHRITTYRNLPSGIGNQKTYQLNLSNQSCMIQPFSAEYAAKTNMVFGRSYNLFLPLNTDVQISDKVVDQDGDEYRVTGSLKRNYGVNSHLTFTMTREVGATPDQ